MRGRVRRISDDLDNAIKEMASKNSMKYIEASKEMARLTNRVKSKVKIYKEIRW